MSSHVAQLQVEQLLKDTWKATGAVYLPLLILWLPVQIISLVLGGMIPGVVITNLGVLTLLNVINSFAITPLFTGASIFLVYQSLTNQRVTIADSVSLSVQRWIKLVVLTFLLIALLIPAFILLIIPGIYLSIRLNFVYPALVIENCSITGAFSRSWQLTKGYWWRIVWVFLVPGIMLSVVVVAISLILSFSTVGSQGVNGVILLLAFLITPLALVYFVLVFRGLVKSRSVEESNGSKQALS